DAGMAKPGRRLREYADTGALHHRSLRSSKSANALGMDRIGRAGSGADGPTIAGPPCTARTGGWQCTAIARPRLSLRLADDGKLRLRDQGARCVRDASTAGRNERDCYQWIDDARKRFVYVAADDEDIYVSLITGGRVERAPERQCRHAALRHAVH